MVADRVLAGVGRAADGGRASGADGVAGRTLPVPARTAARIGLHVAGTAASGWLVGTAVRAVAPSREASWIVGRASGISCLLLLTVLAVTGMVLAHPWRVRLRRPHPVTRLRLHVSLSAFTLALFVLHVVVLATDRWAGVGWWGSLLPMASHYRPVPVTLGVLAGYAGLASGLTAAFAGRWAGRLWWPLHRVAAVALVLSWAHGLLSGSDTRQLLPLYLGTGAVVLAVGASRYVATTPRDRVRALIDSTRPDPEDSAL